MSSSTVINCPIHGFITLSPRMLSIVDTPEFKRLHNLRQLGVAYIVYPSANHTRFEHSLGVAHLAKLLIKNLQTNQPELCINNNQVELVQIAGLIHDLGHGPFSHLWDEYMLENDDDEHEERGIKIFKTMVQKYTLPFTSQEVNQIVEMVNPSEAKKLNFLYQIVANKMCGIDVDKIDYLQRDSYHVGFGVNNKFERLITMCRVVEYNGHQVLGWPMKLQNEILNLFNLRYRLHKQVYNHHSVKAAEYLVYSMLLEIKQNRTSEDLYNMYGWNDSIINIPLSDNHKKCLNSLYMRRLPKMLGEQIISVNDNSSISSIENQLSIVLKWLEENNVDHFNWSKIKIGFVSGNNENPLYSVVYYDKEKVGNTLTGFTIREYDSFMVPKNYQEYIYRIFIDSNKNNDHEMDAAKKTWFAIMGGHKLNQVL